MKNHNELKKIHDVLIAQAKALTVIISPESQLRNGKPPPENVALMLADSAGLQMYALAAIIEVLIDITQPMEVH